MSETILTTEEAAKILRVSPWTVRRLASEGKMAYFRAGRLMRFRLSDVQDYIKSTLVMPEGDIMSSGGRENGSGVA